jgi:hypothetical protein
MDAESLASTHWRKSSWSIFNGNCVEVAVLPDGIVVRDSKDADGPVLRFTSDEWDAFIREVRSGKSAPALPSDQSSEKLPGDNRWAFLRWVLQDWRRVAYLAVLLAVAGWSFRLWL